MSVTPEDFRQKFGGYFEMPSCGPNDSQATDMLTAAVAYARAGIKIFPCANKKPLTSNGFYDASSDEAKILTWWERFPRAQIGLATGQANDLFVVDVDGAEGVKVVKDLHLPETRTIQTQPGHWQLWFRQPAGVVTKCSTGAIGPEVDTRGDGGYVVCPPSLHHRTGRAYRIVKDLPLADAPGFLLDPPTPDAGTAGDTQNGVGGAHIPEGHRNATLASLAGTMRKRGLGQVAICAALLRHNDECCDPPLPEFEVRAIAASVSRYPAGTPSEPQKADSIHSAHMYMKFGQKEPEGRKLPFKSARTIAAETPETIDWLCRPYVAAGAIVELDGKIKLAGKTTWATALCRAVLDGLPFMGESTAKTPIVYLTEQPPATWRVALERAGLLGRDDFHCLYFRDVRGLSWLSVAEETVTYCRTVGARFLVVDTLGQFAGISGDSENNAGDAMSAMSPLMEAAGHGLAIMVLRHERKSGGAVGESGRGSSGYSGAVDVVLSLRRPEGNTRKTLRSIHAVGRFEETPDEMMIDLTPTGYVCLGSARDVAEAEAWDAIIAAAPKTAEEAVPLDGLIQGTNITRSTAQRVIKKLCSEGLVSSLGEGKKGKPFRFFLAEKDSAQTPITRVGGINHASNLPRPAPLDGAWNRELGEFE